VPSKFASKETPRDRSVRPARHGPASDAAPGSRDKAEALKERKACGLNLHPSGDSYDPHRLSLNSDVFARLVLGEIGTHQARHACRIVNDLEMCGTKEKSSDRAAEKLPKASAPTPGDRVRLARRRMRLSVRQAAKKAGVGLGAMYEIEGRRKTPGLLTLWRLAHALGTDVDWLGCFAREAGAVRCLCG
jgi:DNA-binding XRE family transcriptional regulator